MGNNEQKSEKLMFRADIGGYKIIITFVGRRTNCLPGTDPLVLFYEDDMLPFRLKVKWMGR